MAIEIPLKRLSDGFPVILKVKNSLGQSREVREIIRSEDLSFKNGEIDFYLIEPTSVNRGMNKHQIRILALQAFLGQESAMSRTVVDDPEDALGLNIR